MVYLLSTPRIVPVYNSRRSQHGFQFKLIDDSTIFFCQPTRGGTRNRLYRNEDRSSICHSSEMYVLPMEGVLATKVHRWCLSFLKSAFTLARIIYSYAPIPQGTGDVTSVPSDSPDYFQTLEAHVYNIDPAWVFIDTVPVLRTPTYGKWQHLRSLRRSGFRLRKTKSGLEAKEIVYKEGFYIGTMIFGAFSGERVQDAIPKVRESMIKQSVAFGYAESEGLVI